MKRNDKYLSFYSDSEGRRLILEYTPKDGCEWIDLIFAVEDDEHLDPRSVSIRGGVFCFVRQQVLNLNSANESSRKFILGKLDGEGEYYIIGGATLGLKHDCKIHRSVNIDSDLFLSRIANVPILQRIDRLVDEPIVIGGESDSAIPPEVLRAFVKDAPTYDELHYYVDMRIQRALEQYFETMTDAERRLSKYIEGRENRSKREKVSAFDAAIELDIERYQYASERLQEMVRDQQKYSEKDWESEILEIILLLYPKYIRALHSVPLKERITSEDVTRRQIDIALLDADGHLDLIELKKPGESDILSKGLYRDNYIPSKTLSGAIMQAEKYILYLQKGGYQEESDLNVWYKSKQYPPMQLRVVNPHAMLILGRSEGFSKRQRQDFEVIRRKYAHIIDIVTYDDLISRVENVLMQLKDRRLRKQ